MNAVLRTALINKLVRYSEEHTVYVTINQNVKIFFRIKMEGNRLAVSNK